MKEIRRRAFARAGLMGNPSDGYFGKTIAYTVRDLSAEIVLTESDVLEIIRADWDQSRFASISDLTRDVRRHGYYGGVRLLKATIKRFVDVCEENGWPLHNRNFTLRYQSTIPRQVGLGGSSALIVAALRCLSEFYGVDVPKQLLPSLALSVEYDELGISAGLQDRVVQVYEGLVYMNFDRAILDQSQASSGFAQGAYETLPTEGLPDIYLAYRQSAAEPTEIVHSDLRRRFENNDPKVLHAMHRLAELTDAARTAVISGKSTELASLINTNFDIRKEICRIAPEHQQMIDTARSTGASAKFAGSGGAITGTFDGETMFSRLKDQLESLDCTLIRPRI